MIGHTLAHYQITAALGAGGMGEVYRATDTKLGREVALKVLPEAFARDAERMARFEREAQLLASINHPNIGALYGLEESTPVRALVMELVEGPNLAERIAEGRIPLSEALSIARQITEALEYAHERGIVHRDLKPANIKVSPNDQVKVLDFGLAKALTSEAPAAKVANSPTMSVGATQAGVILGTAAYMSPEQARGKPVDRRTDIWAFGCVLYELLTGKQAFAGESAPDIVAAVLQTEPDWSLLPSATPAHIRVLLRRCFQKDPRQRLRDIGDARISLEEVISGSAESFADAGVPFPLSRRMLPWVAGALAGVLLAGIIVWRVPHGATEPAMRFSSITNFAGVQAQPSLSPDGRSIAFVSNHNGPYNIYVGLLNGGSLVQVTNDPNLKERPCYSPDGSTLAYARLNDSGIWDIWDVPALGGSSRRLVLHAKDPAWSPDGHALAYEDLGSKTIWTSDATGQNARQLTASEVSDFEDTEPRFSPDGRSLAFVIRLGGGPYGELATVTLDSRKVTRLTHDGALALSPAWTPDSRFIYFASSRGGAVNIWKIGSTGGTPEQITTGQGDDAQLDASADGKRIVFSTFRENINIARMDLDSKAGQENFKLLAPDPARNQIAPAYSPDGSRLAYFSNRKGVERESIWVANADGSNPAELVQDARVNVFPRWMADGEHLVYRSGPPEHTLASTEYRIISLSGGAPQTLLKSVLDLYFDLGSDGRLLFLSPPGKVQSYDPASRQTETLASSPEDARRWLVRWSPDEHSIAYLVSPSKENDPNAGLWVSDFTHPPRQLFRGWVLWYSTRKQGEIYLLEGKSDLSGIFWKVAWNGGGLNRVSQPIRLIYSYWIRVESKSQDYFDVSPDGKHMVINTQGVFQGNIGMIENAR